MTIKLTNHVVAITGAGGRLGKRIVASYLEAGASGAGFYRRLPEENDRTDGVLHIQADVTDEDSVRSGFEQIRDRWGRLDTLVHTVGSWDGRPFLETSLEQWNAQIDLNLKTAFLCFREALKNMSDRGVLIGIASGQGADRGVAGQAAYSASKGGLVRLVESIAAEYRGTGIAAHALAPSTILYDEFASTEGVSADDLAAACVFLSAPAGRSMNGATLRAYGP